MQRSPISWMGGKSLLRKEIIKLLPEHKTYIEVFGGAGWVLFGKEPSKAEVYNDINGELVNFFRMVKHHQPELLRLLSAVLNSRELFERIKNTSLDSLTEIERAVRFYYLNKLSFAGKMEHFGVSKQQKPSINDNAMKTIKQAYKRLKAVWIEKLSFEKLISKFDSDATLFYCDPPYLGLTGYRGIKFDKEEHEALNRVLKEIEGKFILSINDCDEIRDLYQEFNIQEVEVNYSVSKETKGRGKRRELIICNFSTEE